MLSNCIHDYVYVAISLDRTDNEQNFVANYMAAKYVLRESHNFHHPRKFYWRALVYVILCFPAQKNKNYILIWRVNQ